MHEQTHRKVPLQKELDKQKQVRPVHGQGRIVIVFAQMTKGQGKRGRPDPVVQQPTRHRRDGDPHHHLTDLQQGNVHGPKGFRFDARRHEEIVKIHDAVHQIVHDAENESLRGADNVGMPAIEEDRNVMVPMEKDEGFLVNENKKRVQEFRQFAERKDLDPQAGTPIPKVLFGVDAKVFVPRVMEPNVDEGRKGADKAQGREGRQKQVPAGHGCAPIPGIAVAKIEFATVNHESVECHGQERNPGIAFHEIIHGGRTVIHFETVRRKNIV